MVLKIDLDDANWARMVAAAQKKPEFLFQHRQDPTLTPEQFIVQEMVAVPQLWVFGYERRVEADKVTIAPLPINKTTVTLGVSL